MQRLYLTALICQILFAGAVATSEPAAADNAAGAAAFARGDFALAETEWAEAAGKGDAEAAFGLGEVYEQGKGDYRRADRWYGKAAEQGNTEAEYRLMLIWMAGNKQFQPDLARAYGWMLIASEGGAKSDTLKHLRRELEAHVSDESRIEGRKFAATWRAARAALVASPAPLNPLGPVVAATPSPPQPAAPQPAAPAPLNPPTPIAEAPQPATPQPATPAASVPPRPIIAETSSPQPAAPQPATPAASVPPAAAVPPVAAAPLVTPPIGQQAAVVPPAPIPAPPPPDPRARLEEALKGLACASVHIGANNGTILVSGSVSDEPSRAKLASVADSLPSGQRPEMRVDVIPPPLCQFVVQLDGIARDGVAAAGVMDLTLLRGDSVLKQGQPIQLEIKSRAGYPVSTRIDYFTLDGQVLHMWPNRFVSATQIGAGETRQFLRGTWEAPDRNFEVGGEPFGTEFIVAIATARPLNLGANRPAVEPAGDYLRDLVNALRASQPVGRPQNLMATTFIHTAAP